MEPELHAGCLRPAAYLYYQLPLALSVIGFSAIGDPKSTGSAQNLLFNLSPSPVRTVKWKFKSQNTNSFISNYIGTSSDEQDEFTMSLWPNHWQTPSGKSVLSGWVIEHCTYFNENILVKTC